MKSYEEYTERGRLLAKAQVTFDVKENRAQEIASIESFRDIKITDLGRVIEIEGPRVEVNSFLANDRRLSLSKDQVKKFILKELEKQYAPAVNKAKTEVLRRRIRSTRVRPGAYEVKFKSYDSRGVIYDIEVFIERNLSGNANSRWEWSGSVIGKESIESIDTNPERSKRDIIKTLENIQAFGLKYIGLGEISVYL